jgi:hypothetical protein
VKHVDSAIGEYLYYTLIKLGNLISKNVPAWPVKIACLRPTMT